MAPILTSSSTPPHIAFLGGISGIGKSTIAARLRQSLPWLQVATFSDLMLRHLPDVSAHRSIASLTSREERESARQIAVDELRSFDEPTLVTGHYSLCVFSNDGTLNHIEVAFPQELLSLTVGLMLVTAEERTISARRKGSTPLMSWSGNIALEKGIEEAIFNFLSISAGPSKLRVDLDIDDPYSRISAFLARLWPGKT